MNHTPMADAARKLKAIRDEKPVCPASEDEIEAARASAKDVIETALRQAYPLSASLQRDPRQSFPGFFDVLEGTIADALVKAWQR